MLTTRPPPEQYTLNMYVQIGSFVLLQRRLHLACQVHQVHPHVCMQHDPRPSQLVAHHLTRYTHQWFCNVRKVSFDPWVVMIGRLGRGVARPVNVQTLQRLSRARLSAYIQWRTRWAIKTRPLCFTACNFTSIDHHIGTKFGTNPRYFILNITSKFSNPDKCL